MSVDNFPAIIDYLNYQFTNSNMMKYANGLKPVFNNCTKNMLRETPVNCKTAVKINPKAISEPLQHQVLIQNGSPISPNYSSPLSIINRSPQYNSKIHNQLKDAKNHDLSLFDNSGPKNCDKMTCQILLLFSQDGIDYANEAVWMARTVHHEVV